MRELSGLGKISCSKLRAIMGGPPQWIGYRAQIIDEWRLLGNPQAIDNARINERTSAAMRHGLDHEDQGIAEFLLRHDEVKLEEKNTSVFVHRNMDYLCGTPDLCWSMSGLELKCPFVEARHVLHGQPVPVEHWPQLQGYIAITDVRYWFFVSYFVTDQAQSLYTEIRVNRDDAYINRMLARAERFWDYTVQEDEEAIYDYYPEAAGFGDTSLPILF